MPPSKKTVTKRKKPVPKGTKKTRNAGTERFIKQKKTRQAAFLEQYRTLGTIRQACEVVEIHRNTYHKWTREDPEFVLEFEQAVEDCNDTLIKEARRRAIHGVDEPIYYKGVPVGKKTWHSDSLLMFLLKAGDPKFKETHPGTGKPTGATPPGGDRVQLHVKQQLIKDPAISIILCNLEEALVHAGFGRELEE